MVHPLGAQPEAGAVMATQRQIEANRENARKSTGPKTEAGKAVSSANALRHGLTAERLVLLLAEDGDSFERLRESVIADLAPAGALPCCSGGSTASPAWRRNSSSTARLPSITRP